MDRAKAMAADGRRVGRLQAKRYVELLADAEARAALVRAIKAEPTPCRDAWGNGFVDGLRDGLREFDARSNLGLLGQ